MITYLEPIANALGQVSARLGLILIIILVVSLCIAAMAGGARKQIARRQFYKEHGEGKSWWL